MSKLQYQKGSYMLAIPPHIVRKLKAKKGDEILVLLTEKGDIKVIKFDDK